MSKSAQKQIFYALLYIPIMLVVIDVSVSLSLQNVCWKSVGGYDSYLPSYAIDGQTCVSYLPGFSKFVWWLPMQFATGIGWLVTKAIEIGFMAGIVICVGAWLFAFANCAKRCAENIWPEEEVPK